MIFRSGNAGIVIFYRYYFEILIDNENTFCYYVLEYVNDRTLVVMTDVKGLRRV